MDLIGLLLVGIVAVWMSIAGSLTATDPSGVVGLTVASAVSYSCARAASRLHPLLVPAAAVGLVSVLLLGSPTQFLGPEPDAYPLGYANANGELLVHAAAATLLIRAAAGTRSARFIAGTAAAVLGALPFALGSLASGLLGLGVVAIGLGSPRRGSGRLPIVGVAIVFVSILLATTVAAATYRSDGGSVKRVLNATITERRVVLWQESVALMARSPITGVGFGRFEYQSALARSEEDVRWVPNAFLELGAEAGIVGLVLTALLFAWGFARLYVATGPGEVRAIGAAGWGVLGIHACMDYTLHFAAIPLMAAALLGAATSANWE